ncbi:sulfite exporter TauE/SafE family protein [Klebsiella pneumoniae]
MITAMTITMRPHPPRRWWRRSGRTRISGPMPRRSTKRFDGRQVTTGQIVLFGLTGGLIPCPASITVLLICLQLKKFSLGATLVLGFSVGLALTLVASGAIAALSLKHATRRWPWLNDLSRKAPWFSGLLIIVVGIYMMLHGLSGL